MKWLCLLLLLGCRTRPFPDNVDLALLPDLAPEPCGRFVGIGCPPGQFCETPVGFCQVDAPGVCVPVPTVCDHTFSPVCGCDFVTYTNDCERRQAQVALLNDGPCEGPDLAF